MSKEQVSPESEPVAAELTEQDLEALSEEQLREMIDNPQPEPPVAEPEPEPAVEQELEAPESVEEVAEPDPVNGEVVEDDRLSKLERMFEQAELKREAEAARNQHLRFELDRKQGEIGHLKNQMRQPVVTQPAQDDYGYPEAQQQSQLEPVVREVRGEIDQLRVERTQTACQQTLAQVQAENAQFWDSLGDKRSEFETTWNSRFSQEMQTLGLTDAAASGDMKRATSIVRAAYTAALAESRIEWLNKTMEKNRTAPPSPQIREAKLAAASGASGSRRPTARPKPKSLDEMSADEIKAEIDRREQLGIDVR